MPAAAAAPRRSRNISPICPSSCASAKRRRGNGSKGQPDRAAKKTRITIHSARPGVVIGKKGADIEKLRLDIAKMTNSEVSLNIVEIRKPEIDARSEEHT